MNTFDIPININVTAATEEEAEQIVAKLMAPVMAVPALQRSVNEWDFIVFLTEEEANAI